MLWMLKIFLHALFRVIFSLKFYGAEKVPLEGPIILASNHLSYLDPIILSLPFRRQPRFMAWDKLFTVPVLGFLIRHLGAFPVDLERGARAFIKAQKLLEQEEIVGIFPEGGRTLTGELMPFKRGVAKIAIKTHATIVPITITGAFQAWPKSQPLPRPARISVTFHDPIVLSREECDARIRDRGFEEEILKRIEESISRYLERD